MIRKLFCLLITILLLVQIPVMGIAAETESVSAAVRSAYWTDNTVYVFSDYSGIEAPESMDVSLMWNNQVVSTTTPVSMANAGKTAHYLLLVDRSTSMSRYRNQIFSFVNAAMKTEKTDLKISVAFFDMDYQLVDTGLESYRDVRSALWNITNNRDESDICGAVAWGLEYLGENAHPAGDVSNLVLITDGQPWYSNHPNTQSTKKTEALQNASAMMSAYPDVTLHTLCFGNWDKDAFAVLSAGRGLHLSTASSKITDAGNALADYSDSLCMATFPLAGYENEAYTADNLIFCVGKNLNSIGRVRNITVAVPEAPAVLPVVPVVPEETDPSQEPTDPVGETTEPADPTDPTGEETEPTDSTEETSPVPVPGDAPSGDEETTEATVAETDATEPTAEAEEPEGSGTSCWVFLFVGIGAAVVILAVVLFVKKGRAPADSVRMRVDVLTGNVTRMKKLYYLTDQILIGTDKRCHIVIDDPGAAPVNTRIFKQGQMIYIEDMDSPGGTLLGGMRIYSSNRLRSGDDVTIGTVTLRILF